MMQINTSAGHTGADGRISELVLTMISGLRDLHDLLSLVFLLFSSIQLNINTISMHCRDEF